MAARLILPAGEDAEAWREAFQLAGVDVEPTGPPIEIVVHSRGWLLRVYADDAIREVPVEAAVDEAGREQIAILAMSLLVPGVVEVGPEVGADSGARVEREVEVEVEHEVETKHEVEVEHEREVEVEVEREVEVEHEVEREVEVEVEVEDEREVAVVARPPRREPKPERTKPERTKPERTKPERTKPERAKPERARPTPPARARAAAPPTASPWFLGSPALLVHADHLPTLALSAGAGAEFGSGLRPALLFTGVFPAAVSGFDEDGATRRIASLGARFALAWVPLKPAGPLVGAAVGVDVRRFGQDGAPVAWVTVPALEITGGAALRPRPGVAIEPFATLRVDLRPLPMDVGGGQARDLVPAALLVGVRIGLGGTPDEKN